MTNEKQGITENMNLHQEWYKRANKVKTAEEATQLQKELFQDYHHDYGTICHAIAASTLATFNHLAHREGITGFQAGAIGWQIFRELFHIEGSAKIVKFADMLYPQYADKFEKTMDTETFEWLQEEAKKHLAERGYMHEDVKAHMESIVNGNVPFGYTIKEEE